MRMIYKGLERSYIKTLSLKDDFRPGLFPKPFANRFGFKDKGVVEKMINRCKSRYDKSKYHPGRLQTFLEFRFKFAKRQNLKDDANRGLEI